MLRLAFAIGVHDPEIMLGMLIEVFSGDAITRGHRFTRQCDIALEHLIGVSADFEAWTIAVEGLGTMGSTRASAVVTAASAAATTASATIHVAGIVVTAAARPFVGT